MTAERVIPSRFADREVTIRKSAGSRLGIHCLAITEIVDDGRRVVAYLSEDGLRALRAYIDEALGGARPTVKAAPTVYPVTPADRIAAYEAVTHRISAMFGDNVDADGELAKLLGGDQ